MGSDRIPNDATRVGTAHGEEVHYGCGQLDCTPEQLRVAVSAVGQDVDAVRQHLSQPSV